MRCILLLLSLLIYTDHTSALTVHAVEIGIGKFHRMDNQKHPYGPDHAWAPMILPDGKDMKDTPLTVEQSPEVYSIFFSSVDQLLKSVFKLHRDLGRRINILTIHAHGLPGGIFVPQTDKQRDGLLCALWRRNSAQEDIKNYNQYYSKVPLIAVKLVKATSYIGDTTLSRILAPLYRDPCISGLGAFERSIKKIPHFREAFSDDLEMKFLSCSVGQGRAGKDFLEGLGEMVLNSSEGRIDASEVISLGDWSTPEGLQFWDGQTFAQVRRDNRNYVRNKRDSEIALDGSILTSFRDESGKVRTRVTKDVSVMTWRRE